MQSLTRVLCVDDSPDITGVLRYVISADPTMECVGCLHSAKELREQVVQLRPDVLLLDATMPGEDPIEEMRALVREFPDVKAIVYSGHDGPEFTRRVMDAGAWGCVPKDGPPAAVLRAIGEAASAARL